MGLLDGHKALVTGGGSGIGAATCRRMAAEGAAVAVVDRDAESARAVATAIGGHAFVTDVSDHEQVLQTVAAAENELGGLSIVFANAGIGSFGAVHEMDPTEWRKVLDVNLSGVFHTVRECLPHLAESGRGSVVCTASISGVRPAEGEAAYAATKAGVAAFCASVALEYGPSVRCNAVSPGMIATALTAPLIENFPDLVERMVDKTPAGRVGTPDDIADVVVFLCSDLARFVTGQNIVVDGGMTLHGSGVDGLYRYFKPGGPLQGS
jgi:NAD(P)-dependent dehydrogenase (short-subunit alcohol dehydrogenase family)